MRHIHYILLTMVATLGISCVDKEAMEDRLDSLENRIAALENAISDVNGNAVAVSRLLKDSTIILGFQQTKHGYVLELNTDTVEVCFGTEAPGIVPIVGIDEENHWVYSIDNGNTFLKIEGSMTPDLEPEMIPIVRNGRDGHWEISTDNGLTWEKIKDENGKSVPSTSESVEISAKTIFEKIELDKDSFTFTLKPGRKDIVIPIISSFKFQLKGYQDEDIVSVEETRTYDVVSEGVKNVAIQASEGWNARLEDGRFMVSAPSQAGLSMITIILVSDKGYVMTKTFSFKAVGLDLTACKEWNDFVMNSEENVLLDFSYAGYRYGEYSPADVESYGYTQYNVREYYTSEQTSDRDAFIAALTAALGPPEKSDEAITFPDRPSAKAVIYFPEGEYILHNESDNEGNASPSIIIRAGDFILKGAGKDKTTLVMQTPMLPRNETELYSSPDMIQLKHNSGLGTPTPVTGNVAKGDFSVDVTSTSGFSEEEWVCLHVKNNSSEFIAREVSPYQVQSSWDISTNGVEVTEYHKIKKITGTTITFFEPVMHEVDAQWEWKILKYPHYANVGVEDLTFKGNAPSDFEHHKDWIHDGGYKPLSMNRLVDSWIRRVGFESVSEACSIINSSNVSAYDIEMKGNRGHAAIRAQASTRVLIAGTVDKTTDNSGLKGNFHGVGVSEHSIGTVLWRNVWGDDSCFESHCKQPRATLIDCCQGGWNGVSQGGDKIYAPHHLSDLTIWNFEATTTESGEFQWWRDTPSWLRILPPVVVGFRSSTGMTFAQEQTRVISTFGEQASPESLYEAQLRLRTGRVPAWLNRLKY